MPTTMKYELETTYVTSRELPSIHAFFLTCATPDDHWTPPSLDQLREWDKVPGVISKKVVVDGYIVACIFVQRRAQVIRTLAVAVSPAYRRQGIGSHLYSLWGRIDCKGFTAAVHERALGTQLFFRELGFTVRKGMVPISEDELSSPEPMGDRQIIFLKRTDRVTAIQQTPGGRHPGSADE